jgi:hypothetical protein
VEQRLATEEVIHLDAQGVEEIDALLELLQRDNRGSRRILITVGAGEIAVICDDDLGIQRARVEDPLGPCQDES